MTLIMYDASSSIKQYAFRGSAEDFLTTNRMLTPFLTRFSSCADRSKQNNVYKFLKSFGFNGGSTPKTLHTDL